MTTRRIIDLQEASVSEDMWVMTDNTTTGTKKFNAKGLWDAATAASEAAAAAQEAVEGIPRLIGTMTAAAADTLFSADTTTETFAQRVSAAGGRCRVESLQGNTVVWNQLAQTVSRTISNNGISIVFDGNGKVTVSGTASSDALVACVNPNSIAVISGHKYLMKGAPSGGSSSTYNMVTTNTAVWGAQVRYDYGSGIILTAQASGSVGVMFTVINGQTVDFSFYPQFFDLTRMFGAGNEPSTVAEFERMFPESYYPYDAGSLLSVNIEGIGSAGETLAIPAATYFPQGMRSAGSARDELTAEDAVTRVGAVVIDGTNVSIWGVTQQGGNTHALVDNGENSMYYNGTQILCICDKLPSLSGNAEYDATNGISIASARFIRFVCPDIQGMTAAQVNVWLQSNPLTVHYPLATPTTTEINPPLNLTYPTQQGGTESIVVPTGGSSAPPVMVTTQAKNADGVADMALSQVAPIEHGAASTNYAVGSYLVHGGTLYRVTSAIATGETITPGTNVTATTVMAEIVRLTQ